MGQDPIQHAQRESMASRVLCEDGAETIRIDDSRPEPTLVLAPRPPGVSRTLSIDDLIRSQEVVCLDRWMRRSWCSSCVADVLGEHLSNYALTSNANHDLARSLLGALVERFSPFSPSWLRNFHSGVPDPKSVRPAPTLNHPNTPLSPPRSPFHLLNVHNPLYPGTSGA